jgi:hypothetical protein
MGYVLGVIAGACIVLPYPLLLPCVVVVLWSSILPIFSSRVDSQLFAFLFFCLNCIGSGLYALAFGIMGLLPAPRVARQ